ncbi:MAG TPA: hypothetical protein VMV32_07400 [Ignavibacteriaceae bacterium]|nr:hypothetical protein [Ignavibacteriaceae bacterium]
MDDGSIRAHVISKKTGEITTDLHVGDMIVRKSSIKSHKNKTENIQEYIKWNLENFYKTHVAEVRLWMNELSQAEKAFLFSVVPYVSFEDCHLQYTNGVDIGTEELIKITGLSRGLVYQTIESLIKKDILYKGKNSKNRQYFVNPWLFCKGNRINKVLRTMFKNYRIRVLNGRQWKNIKNSDL